MNKVKIDFKGIYKALKDKYILHLGDPYKCRYNGENGSPCQCDECDLGFQCYEIQKRNGDIE